MTNGLETQVPSPQVFPWIFPGLETPALRAQGLSCHPWSPATGAADLLPERLSVGWAVGAQ